MLVPLQCCTQDTSGGKAEGLRRLQAAGLPVPITVCLPVDAYLSALPKQLPPLDDNLGVLELTERYSEVLARLESWQPNKVLTCELMDFASQVHDVLIVRSSASCEDLLEHSAAGVFCSEKTGTGIGSLISSIRRVWCSLWQPAAWVTLLHYGSWPGDHQMGALIQPYLAATVSGTALLSSAAPDRAIQIEFSAGPAENLAFGETIPHRMTLSRQGAIETRDNVSLSSSVLKTLRELLLVAEEALRKDKEERGSSVVVEWLLADGVIWLVQGRALSTPTENIVQASSPDWIGDEMLTGVWHWDREHNPDPLSPAHASLIHMINTRTPYRDLVVREGYLFSKRSTEPSGHSRSKGKDSTQAQDATLEEDDDLSNWLAQQEIELDGLPPSQRLERAIDTFMLFYHRYRKLTAAQQRPLDQLRKFLSTHNGPVDEDAISALLASSRHQTISAVRQLHGLVETLSSQSREKRWLNGEDEIPPAEVVDFLRRFGVLTAAWDVAQPTFGECLDQFRLLLSRVAGHLDCARDPCDSADAAAVQVQVERLFPNDAARRSFRSLISSARRARESSEDDDLLFSRALWLVRKSLLETANRLIGRGQLSSTEDIFFVSIKRTLSAFQDEASQMGHVENGREQWLAQCRLRAPDRINNGTPIWSDRAPSRLILKGDGLGAPVRGRVVRVTNPMEMLSADVAGSVLVCRTLLPSLALLLPRVTALVTDFGGLLSHAGLLAREYGVTAVVGTESATTRLKDGDQVWVDGERGLVIPLNGANAIR